MSLIGYFLCALGWHRWRRVAIARRVIFRLVRHSRCERCGQRREGVLE